MPFEGSNKTGEKIRALLTDSVTNTLLQNRVPVNVAEKLTSHIVNNININQIYNIISHEVQSQQPPKVRILDRTIVHMFMQLYQTLHRKSFHRHSNDFFNLVPRGECLDLFLQLIKEYCMGDEEIKNYTYRISPLIESHRNGNDIDWNAIYATDEFKDYMTGLLKLIFTHLRKDQTPIPALENKIPVRYQPGRINTFLNQICRLIKSNPHDFSSSS